MDTNSRPPFDLDAYCNRIGYTDPRSPSREVLEALHLAHASHIPFENLDILLGRPILLDLESLQAKLVRDRRGGYCFEHNTLFAGALESIGFQVTPLAARVRMGATMIRPRTHMLLKVDLDGVPWLADVGFGGEGLLLPVPMTSRQVSRQFAWAYRVVEEAAGHYVLQSERTEGWLDLYAFTLEPQKPIDYEMANYFTSTHPTSRFLHTPTAQKPTPEARYILRGQEFAIHRGDEVVSRIIEEDEELLSVLDEWFGLPFPKGTRFRPAGAPT